MARPELNERWTDRSDRQELARLWEGTVESMGDYPTRRAVLVALQSLCTAYLRAQGIKVGSVASYNRGSIHILHKVTGVLDQVQFHHDGWRYERLIAIGFGNRETVMEIFKGLNEGKLS